MAREKGPEFCRYVDIVADGVEPPTKEVAQTLHVSPESVNRWRRTLKHRVDVFSQVPDFDEQGKQTGWKTIT